MANAIPSPTPPPGTLAPLHLRLFALLLDYLLVVVLLNLADQLTMGEHWDLRAAPSPSLGGLLYWGSGGVLLFLLKEVPSSRSPGKWLVGIAVRSAADPARLPPLAARVARNAALILLPVEGLLVFTDPYCRRLGDRWAGTVVVLPQGVMPLGRRLLLLSCLVLAVLLIAFLVGPWNLHRTAAWQEGMRILRTHPDLAARLGEGYALKGSPLFDLHLTPAGGTATIRFTTQPAGGKDAGRPLSGSLVLELDRAADRWALQSFSLDGGDSSPQTPGAAGMLKAEPAPPRPGAR